MNNHKIASLILVLFLIGLIALPSPVSAADSFRDNSDELIMEILFPF
jgi:hypothetical protein